MPDQSFKTPSREELLSGLKIRELKGNSVRILIGGDLSPIGSVEGILSGENAISVWEDLLPELEDADLRIANLECPLTKTRTMITKTGPVLRADPACATGIRDAGFDVMDIANNHILDMGVTGLEDTIEACHRGGMQVTGAGMNLTDALKPFFFEIRGVKVAIICVAEREFSIAGRNKAGAAPVSYHLNFQQIQATKKLADIIIFIVHGGIEYYPLPRPGLVDYCRFLVDAGAHAVLCHHSHVAGPIEIYHGVPIAYGLGNLLFEPLRPKSKEWYLGYLVDLNIDKEGVSAISIIFFDQMNKKTGIAKPTEAEQWQAASELSHRGLIVQNRDMLEVHWEEFCKGIRDRYLLNLRSPVLFPGVGRILKTFPFMRTVLLSKRSRSVVQNLIMCDSHREVVEWILDNGWSDEP